MSSDGRVIQAVVTFTRGGIGAFVLWPHLDGLSRGLTCVFGVIAAVSIQQGTWMEDTRKLRREARDHRRQVLGQAKDWVLGK